MSRGTCEPRSVVRPSAAFDRGPAVSRSRVDRRVSASGPGSRVPWRDVASWAGRSASSGLSGILSCRPRGDLVSTPRGTQTRRAPDSARRVFVGRMIRPASNECQTSRACDVEVRTLPRARGWPGSSLETVVRARGGLGRDHDAVRTLPSLSAAPVQERLVHLYSLGVSRNRLAGPGEPVLSSPDLRRRETLAEHSGTFRNPRNTRDHPVPRKPVRDARDPGIPFVRHPGDGIIQVIHDTAGSDRTNGREAGLASRPG